MKISKGSNAAKELLDDLGFDEITDIPIDLFASGLNATVIETDLINCDGKITFGKDKVIIKVDSKISFPARKRFVLAHEIGHLVMHRNYSLPPETFLNLSLIAGLENHMKSGVQEVEANEFAGELLMPEKIFLEAAHGRKFSPALLKSLAERFKASITAVAFRCLYFDLHPFALFYIENGIQRYWRKSSSFRVWVPEVKNGLEPPSNSVAMEYIRSNYDFIYKQDDKAQLIKKSTWFDIERLRQEENDIYEYCIPTKSNKSVLSVVWEN